MEGVARTPAAGEPEVYSITGAQTPHSRDLDQRVNRYLISMAIRTACVVLVLVVQGPLRWVFAVGAIVLPYIAVIAANNAGPRRQGPSVTVGDLRRPQRQLTEEAPAEPLEGSIWTGDVGDAARGDEPGAERDSGGTEARASRPASGDPLHAPPGPRSGPAHGARPPAA